MRVLCSTAKSTTEDHYTCSALSQWKQNYLPPSLHLPCTTDQWDNWPLCKSIMATSWPLCPAGQEGCCIHQVHVVNSTPQSFALHPHSNHLYHHSPFCSLSHFHCMIFWSKVYALCHLQFLFILQIKRGLFTLLSSNFTTFGNWDLTLWLLTQTHFSIQ